MKESGACQDGDDRLEYIGQDDQQNFLLAKDPIKVGQAGVAAAVVADVIPQDVFGDDNGSVAAAQQIRGRHGDQHRCDQMPIHHRSRLFPFGTDDEPNRRSFQAEGVADLVLQIPLVGEVEQLARRCRSTTKVGRLDAHLGHVVDLQPAALVGGRLDAGWWRPPGRC